MKPESNETMLFQNMRAMISLIDRLRDFNLQEYISLPRIAVLGEQSAGKSSLLEAVAGLNFLPRGSGIVTRRPLELRMIRTSVSTPYFVFPRDYKERKFTNPDEVRQTIEELTSKGTGGEKKISDDPIVLTVYSANVPDLTLIDLPGITRNPVGDQPQNIEEITKNLVRKYCEDENTLILCVIPANIDLSTSDALSFGNKLDPTGQRTLGVLTKIDLMDEGNDARKTLMNEEIPLKYGYVGVKGRSQAEIKGKMSVTDAIQKELNYFGTHPIYQTLPAEVLGTRALVDKSSSILYTMIQKSLPKIRNEIIDRKKKAKDALTSLGEDFPDGDERKLELIFRMVREFKDEYDQELKGKYFYKKSSKIDDKKNRETINFNLGKIYSELYEEFSDKGYKATNSYKDEDITYALKTYQGNTIPGFYSFDSFLYLVNPQLEKLKGPVFRILDEAKNIIESRGIEILERVMKKFSKLHSEVKEAFSRVLIEYKNRTYKIIENIIRCEENYIFTNDNLFLKMTDGKNDSMDTSMKSRLREIVDNYFFIVVRNLRDSIPKIVGQFFLTKFNENLEVEILNHLNKKKYCIESLNENKTNATLRQKLKLELQSLTKAENLLINDFNLSFDQRVGVEYQDVSIKVADPQIQIEEIEAANDEFIEFNLKLLRTRDANLRPNSPANNKSGHSQPPKTQQQNYGPQKNTIQSSRPAINYQEQKHQPVVNQQNLQNGPQTQQIQRDTKDNKEINKDKKDFKFPTETKVTQPTLQKQNDPWDLDLINGSSKGNTVQQFQTNQSTSQKQLQQPVKQLVLGQNQNTQRPITPNKSHQGISVSTVPGQTQQTIPPPPKKNNLFGELFKN